MRHHNRVRMRIAFFGQTGPYAPLALRRLCMGVEGVELVLVVEGTRRPLRRKNHERLAPSPGALPSGEVLHRIAVAAGVPALVTTDVNGREAIDIIAEYTPDLLVCVGFDRLFSAPLLQVSKEGGINAHPSMLPELRGPSPIFWAVREGRRSLAVSLHALDAQEDHGAVYAQEAFELPPQATTEEIYRIAGELAGTMLVTLLPNLHRVTPVPQDHARATRARRPTAEDAFFSPGDWEGTHLLNFVNVAPFCRAAWTRLGSEVFFVRRGLGFEPGRRLPGQYLQQGAFLWVQCRDGVAQMEIQV